MTIHIAVQRDEVHERNGDVQSYSRRWAEIAAEHDARIIPVDAFADDALHTIAQCDGFMWRYDPPAQRRIFAAKLLQAIEEALQVPVFPSLASRWHFEDKVGQYYYLAAAGIGVPATHVFWSRDAAMRFCDGAAYPFVLKLAAGYQSANVRLVRTASDARYYVDQLFSHGLVSLGYRPASRPRLWLRRLRAAREVLVGRNPYGPTPDADLQYGYFLAQQFLPGNEFDVRITITGNRAFGFRRFNRPGDFRASGSGRVDWDPAAIPLDAVRLGFAVARRLGSQTVTIDVLRDAGRPVIVELGLAYTASYVKKCPGHWTLNGSPQDGQLGWVDGSMDPADAIFIDFVADVRRARGSLRTTASVAA